MRYVALFLFLVAAPLDEVCFTPPGGCADRALFLMAKAKAIRVQEYELTSPAFIDALVKAHERKADVEIILDKSQREVCDQMAASGVSAFLDSKHAKAHSKVIVLDAITTIEGSYNLTTSAEKRNAENMTIRTNRANAKRYLDNYAVHRAHSVACGGGR